MMQFLNWFRRRHLESGLDRELRYHVDRRMSDLVLSGLPEHAREAAWDEVGAALKEFEGPDGFTGPCRLLVGAGRR